jgi:hypothetical protein
MGQQHRLHQKQWQHFIMTMEIMPGLMPGDIIGLSPAGPLNVY